MNFERKVHFQTKYVKNEVLNPRKMCPYLTLLLLKHLLIWGVASLVINCSASILSELNILKYKLRGFPNRLLHIVTTHAESQWSTLSLRRYALKTFFLSQNVLHEILELKMSI